MTGAYILSATRAFALASPGAIDDICCMRRLLLLIAFTGTATAGGFGIPEIGARQTAMGSIIGRPDDPSSIYHNPAGLVLEPGWNVYLSSGLSLLDTSFELAPWD